MSRRTLLYIRLGVFTAACGFLYIRFRHYDMASWWAAWSGKVNALPRWVLSVVALLMILNWALEAVKWRWLMRPVQRLTLTRAFLATIAGTSIGLITPNRVGEFAGRVLFLDPEHRVQGSFATLLGSIAQFVVTVLAGSIALFVSHGSSTMSGPFAAWLAVKWSALLVGAAAVFLYFSPAAFERLLLAIPFLRRYERHANVLQTYDRSQLIGVFVLSLMRYGVFTVQFALLLTSFAGAPYLDALMAIPLIFLITTLVPTTFLTELGVRGSVAVMFVPGSDEPSVVTATTAIWLINVVLPAMAGSIILMVARIRSARDPG